MAKTMMDYIDEINGLHYKIGTREGLLKSALQALQDTKYENSSLTDSIKDVLEARP